MPSMLVDIRWLNHLIRGKIDVRKCPSCDKDGVEIQSYNDHGKPCSDDDPTAMRETCEDCKGLAYITN